MRFEETKIKGVFIIDLDIREDERGWFSRTFCQKEFEEHLLAKEWKQINHSHSKEKGTIRGMHIQKPPYAEAKLIRCINGRILDVAVDLRQGSPTFLSSIKVELSGENKRMIYIPEGLAHGFQALTDNIDMIYHHSEFYTPEAEVGIRYDDSRLNIEWPLTATNVSEKDQLLPGLEDDFKGY